MRLVKWPKIEVKKCQNLIFMPYPCNQFYANIKSDIRIDISIKQTTWIAHENQILAFFDVYFWPFNKSHEKINAIFVISATMASI